MHNSVVGAPSYPDQVTVRLLARYRRHSESTATTTEQTIEGDTYEAARDQARALAADGDDLLSVLVLD